MMNQQLLILIVNNMMPYVDIEPYQTISNTFLVRVAQKVNYLVNVYLSV